jgi:hypothetical protein
MEQTMPGTCMEQMIPGLPEHHAQLLIIVSHKGGLGRLLRQRDQSIDVFNSLEGFLKY